MTSETESLTFKAYYDTLTNEEKREIRNAITPLYMEYTTFFKKLRENSWSLLEIEKIEKICGQTFII